jgi:hypothetical protein
LHQQRFVRVELFNVATILSKHANRGGAANAAVDDEFLRFLRFIPIEASSAIIRNGASVP